MSWKLRRLDSRTETDASPRVAAATALVLLVSAAVASCTGGAQKEPPFASRMLAGGRRPAEGALTIAYELSDPAEVRPSYQTAIWLEDPEAGTYLIPLFVTDYLAYCGSNHPSICPDWVRVANWGEATRSEFDAVTRATPPVAPGRLTFQCGEFSIPPGTYRYCVQTHIVGAYNILCRGTIQVGGAAASSVAEVTHSPEAHPGAGNVLKNVTAAYRPR